MTKIWAWGAAIVLAGILALAWFALPEDHVATGNGQIMIADAAPPPAPAAAGNAMIADTGKPLDAAQRNAELALESGNLFATEKRDPAWASRSEAAIRGVLRHIDYIDQGDLLWIDCKTTVCQVKGAGKEDEATGTMAPVWDALERATAGDTLRGQGLTRSDTTYETPRSREAFIIHYRRLEAAPAR
ncbi:hypothetical protein [Sphingomonas sp. G-3-2-10]|uniref:hypothetical protein n=1 Tax=Sphingomonas sp. G-3-2-10 TaxID=2728838 RepID=UPI00146CAE9D|nr:hypothetical protein [Sphingomonas sp. G-3-2-10]NML07801.1 hypothetical protein [Sphingomonas sp. G-3-2-10]